MTLFAAPCSHTNTTSGVAADGLPALCADATVAETPINAASSSAVLLKDNMIAPLFVPG
jgi:hypothetical protein